MPQQQPQQQEGDLAALTMETFAGCNTATTRAGVPDEQVLWFDGFMPLASRNCRTLYGIGNALYTASVGKTIVCFYFYNIGSTPYAIVFLSDGSAVQVRTTDGATTTVLPAFTILSPNITQLGISQYGQQYLLIVANQQNGYWVWDGSLLYTAGSLGPGVTLTNVGAGYQSVPFVTVTGGSGNGATFTATIANGVVTNVAITNPGQNYLPSDTVTLVFNGGTQSGTGASLTANLSHQAGGSGASLTCVMSPLQGSGFYVSSVTVNNGGSGYSSETSIAVSGGSPAPNSGVAVLSPVITGGVITSVTVVNLHNNAYLNNTPPTATANDSGFYFVSSVTIGNGGSGYGPNRTITASGGGSPVSQATFSSNVNGSGVITSVTVLSGGNYGSNTPPTLAVTDSTTTATGTVTLMPFGVQGNAVQTYQGYTWIFSGSLILNSAPGSVSNFATSAGGGSRTSSASYLKVGYIGAVSTNGFLFVIGDSSMDYISGVSTTGTPPTTNFTQNNSDPEIGTPYPAAITTLGQEIFIANSVGIFVSSGGAFVKISEPMDGVYNTVANFAGNQLSAAKATIFGKRVWMVLATIINPISGLQVNQLLMVRDKKIWWASLQEVALTFIQGQEINSTYTPWGTDGTHIYPLFQQASTGFTKTVRSKLWDEPGGYESVKADSRFWSLWNCNSTSNTALFVNIDGVTIDGNGNQVTNTQPYTITGPTATGHFCTPPEAIGQQGILTGMTISTAAADMTLVSAKIGAETVGYRG